MNKRINAKAYWLGERYGNHIQHIKDHTGNDWCSLDDRDVYWEFTDLQPDKSDVVVVLTGTGYSSKELYSAMRLLPYFTAEGFRLGEYYSRHQWNDPEIRFVANPAVIVFVDAADVKHFMAKYSS